MNREFLNLAEEVIARCRTLATFSEDTGCLRRTFLSRPMHAVHHEIKGWLEPLGAAVRLDAVGNLRAVYASEEEGAPRLLISSHLDTVPNAGAYDGILGVVLAIALLQALNGRRLPFAVEVVGFSEEEGVRFGVPFIGSRALIGRIDENLLDLRDPAGISVKEAIERFGLNTREIGQARLPNEVFGYLEFHIEQGPVLEQLNLPLAVVESIAGQNRLEITFKGRANHAGTTPMDLRLDAMAGAAEWITIVERIGKEIAGLVATVGSVRTNPGTGNVIAGEAQLSLDVRHREDSIRHNAVEKMIQQAKDVAQRRGLAVEWKMRLNQTAVRMDPFLTDQAAEAIRKAGCPAHHMVSGAGHDAMILAEKVPSAMIFLRTPGGISHDPAETVLLEDVAKAIESGMNLLEQLAVASQLHSRTVRA